MTTAKALAGGMPLAAVTGRADLMDGVHPGGLGGTYGGNPVACAAALAAIDIMRSARTWPPRPARIGDRSIGDAGPAAGRLSRRRRRPGTGGHDGHGDRATRDARTPTRRPPAGSPTLCHQAGVIVLTCGSYGNVIRLLPPLVIEEALLADGLAVLAGAVDQVLSGPA